MSLDLEKDTILTFLNELYQQSVNVSGAVETLKNNADLLRVSNESVSSDLLDGYIDEIVLNMNGLRKAMQLESRNEKQVKETEEEMSLMKAQIDMLTIKTTELLSLNNDLKMENIEFLNRFTKEKDDYEMTIKLLSNDLENQIDECMNLSGKLNIYETVSKATVLRLIKELSLNDVNETDTIQNLLDTLEHLLINKKKEEDTEHNASIIDLDNMHMESIYWKGENTDHKYEDIEEVVPKTNVADESCYNLENLDSELLLGDVNVMLEEIEQIEFENHEHIDFLIEQSHSILMRYILTTLNFEDKKILTNHLKTLFSNYGNILLKKLKKIHGTFVDLNSTCVFEKLEQELAEINDIGRQLDIVTLEKNSLQAQIIEVLHSKQCKDTEVVSLELKICDLSADLTSNVETINKLECKCTELEKLNVSLLYDVEILNGKFKELEEEHNLCDRNELLKNTTELKILEDMLQVLTSNIEKLSEEKETYEKELMSHKTELQQAMHHIRTKDIDLIDKEYEVTSTKEKLDKVQITLDGCLLELETAIEDCIKLNEELDHTKAINVAKEEQFNYLLNEFQSCKLIIETEKESIRDKLDSFKIDIEDCKVKYESIINSIKIEIENIKVEKDSIVDKLNSCKMEIENIKLEKENIEDEVHSCKIDIENYKKESELEKQNDMIKLQSLECYVKEYQDKLYTLEEENTFLRDFQNQFEIVEVKYLDVKKELLLTIEEKTLLQKHTVDLEQVRIDMTESMDIMTRDIEKKDEVIRLNEQQVEDLQKEIEIIHNKKHTDIIDLEEKVTEMRKVLECREKQINEMIIYKKEMMEKMSKFEHEIVNYKNEINLKTNSILEITNKLKIREEEINQQFTATNSYVCEITKLENILKSKDENLKEIKKEIASKNTEVYLYVNEVKSLRKALMDKENGPTNFTKMESALQDMEIKMQTLDKELGKKENENKELIRKAKEALTNERKLLEEIKSLKMELGKENEKGHADYAVLVNAYNELKDRYREKRKRTDDLNLKYEKLLKFCKERGLALPSNN